MGDFNGNRFTPIDTNTRWLDYGPDEYAGITWSNTGSRKIFLGWMSNWMYANVVPTVTWRNAMTIPRELKLKRIGNEIYVASEPVAELNLIRSKPVTWQNVQVKNTFDVTTKTGKISFPGRLDLSLEKPDDFMVILSNDAGEEVVIGYDKQQQQYFIDRTKSGKTGFQKDFAGRHIAPRIGKKSIVDLSLIIDVSSVELFADEGLTVMTEIFFPTEPFKHIRIQSPDNTTIKKLEISSFKNIW
jgi:fructan beta-fructosidase